MRYRGIRITEKDPVWPPQLLLWDEVMPAILGEYIRQINFYGIEAPFHEHYPQDYAGLGVEIYLYLQ